MTGAECPNCRYSFLGRVLAHVPRDDGRFAFRCPNCGAVLGYAEDGIPVIDWFWGTRTRSVITFLVGLVVITLVGARLGRMGALVVVGVVAIAVFAAFLFAPGPRYRVLEKP